MSDSKYVVSCIIGLIAIAILTYGGYEIINRISVTEEYPLTNATSNMVKVKLELHQQMIDRLVEDIDELEEEVEFLKSVREVGIAVEITRAILLKDLEHELRREEKVE
ncbi:MAG: hypothetical protein ACXACB_03105 [Promethearchaeota archaeon]|jgi:hypothetical protein